MHPWIRAALLSLTLLGTGSALAQQTPVAPTDEVPGAPAGFVAPALPKADETNAERGKSQPGNNAPLWRSVRETGVKPGYSSLPDPEAGILIQRFVEYPGSSYTTAGEAWREVRNRWIIPYGGALFVIIAVALGLFYWRKGAFGRDETPTGRVIERFTYFERAAHWTNATAFVILAVSGLAMAFGKFILLPVIGGTLFGWLTYALKNLHNFVGPVFAVSIVIVMITFVRDNLPRAGDLAWLAKVGGLFSEHEVPSHRFNAAEKVIFWIGVFLLGLTAVGSGLVLDKVVPGIEYSRGNMQIAHMIHSVAAVLMMTLFLLHIYLGTIGFKGAFSAMRTGYVDEAWAREHHEYWYDDIKAGKIPAQRTRQSASAPAAVARR